MAEIERLHADLPKTLTADVRTRMEGYRKEGLDLDMTRGKPGADQLSLSQGLFDAVDPGTWMTSGGVDSRNYGGLDGFDEAKRLFADYLGLAPEEIIVGGNSSLAMMHDTVSQLMSHGSSTTARPWWGTNPAFICPVPGYDRHFTILQRYGIRMIAVPVTDQGPDMAAVERLAGGDATIRGLWYVPRYGNPTGYTASAETVERLATLRTAAEDFRILWDDAYAVHHLGGGPAPLACLLAACRKAGNPDRPIIFGSTSKITFPGGGVAFQGSSERNCAWVRERLLAQTIGPDKVNILRHVRFFGDMAGILAHMDRHAALLAPKFAVVDRILTRELSGRGVAAWTRPQGGYFISLDTADGLATAAVRRAAEVGVKVTPAGSTFPYRKDPRDRNIRIAPTFPRLESLEKATEVLAVSILAAALDA
jgi:aspartate/methionine/tyrosine aminotransferase